LKPLAALAKKKAPENAGRHAAPSRLKKLVKRAAQIAPAVSVSPQLKTVGHRATKIAPAVAVVGALAATPLVYHIAAAPASASTTSGAGSAQNLAASLRNPLAPANQRTARDQRTKQHASLSKSAKAMAAQQAVSARHAARHRHRRHTLTCSGSGGTLPANYAAIVRFLTTHGYTGLAAAGVAGNIYQESMGNPESVGTGGGGLIGWTPLPTGFVTGNPAADLHTQLEALLTYNQQWAQYIPTLNAATSATQAADVYMNYFERPGIPAAYNRESAATAVATACRL